MVQPGISLPERPAEGRIVLGGGFTEPYEAVVAAAERMHFPGDPEVVPVAFKWAMEHPKRFARMLEGARFLGNSASGATLPEARKHARDPESLGLREAVMVAGVEPRGYGRLVAGYGILLGQQAGTAWRERGTVEGHIDAGLIWSKLRELGRHPLELVRLRAIHKASSIAALTALVQHNVPAVAAYVENDAFGFRAPKGATREAFELAGGIVMQLRHLGHEAVVGANPDITLRQVYPNLPWPTVNA